jgi:O-antigen/teichoic acid export membrane protein
MTVARSIVTSMFLLTVGRVVTALIMILITALLTRHLGLTGFGHYRTVIAYLAFASALGNFGIYLVGLRELSRKGADQASVLGNALSLRAVTSVIFLGLSVVAAWLLPFAPTVQVGIAVGAAGFAALSLHQQLTGLFQQRLRQSGLILAEVIGAVCTLGAALVLAHLGAGPVAFVVATTAAYAVTLLVSWICARRLLTFRLRFEWQVWRSLLVPALSVALGNILLLTYYRSDTVFLALLRPAQDVGLYGAASRVSDTVIGFALMFIGLIIPILSKHAHDAPTEFRSYLKGSFDTVMLGAVAAAVITYAFAGEIVTLIAGAEFTSAAPPLRVLSLLILIGSSSMLLQQAAVTIDMQTKMIWGYAIAAAIALVAYPVLIKLAGSVGAAWGLVIGESVVWVYAAILVARRTGTWVVSFASMRLLLCGALALIVAALLSHVIEWWPLRMLAVGVCFMALSALLGAIPRHTLIRFVKELRK